MSTATLQRPVEPSAPPPVPAPPKRVPRWLWALVVLGVWIMVWSLTKGQQTLALSGLEQTKFHETLSKLGDYLRDSREGNPIMVASTAFSDFINALVLFLQELISIPAFPRPAAEIGWLGVVAIATWISYAIANSRIAFLTCATFLSFGLFGFWEDSMDLLIVTMVSVGFAVLFGMPLAIWLAVSNRAAVVINFILDLMQTLPTFVYLMPIVLFFGIGPGAAVVSTLIYALPPIVRIAGFGIKEVSPTTVEATDSLGQTTWQRLIRVQIPMARRTIILGLNQTILAALSMAIIASYINGPGLGKPVLSALFKDNFGGGLVPGLLVVAMGVMLDRTVTAASERSEKVARGGGEDRKRRRLVLGGLLIPVAVAVWYSRFDINAARFPELELGRIVADWANKFMDGLVDLLETPAGVFRDLVSYGLLNPLESLLAESPWWLALAGLALLGLVAAGWRAVVPTVLCLPGLFFLDLWNDSMKVLTMTLVATLLVMALGVVFGVWMARKPTVDFLIRPILDAGQTIPAFVYLLPVLALFGPTRFAAIVAALVYAAPASIKLVADGVRGVAPGALEAGRSAGSTTWQEITKVQLPMAKGSLVLATNQGLLFVLAMVVIGGMVGAGALGFAVTYGLAHTEAWGKGIAAGASIVLLGVWLDRIARGAAARLGQAQTLVTRAAADSSASGARA